MNKALNICIAVLFISSCSRNTEITSYKSRLYDGSSGLTKTLALGEGEGVLKVTYWPKELVEASGLAVPEMFFFEMKTEHSSVLFTRSEQHFKLISGAGEYPPAIVFAENVGIDEESRLLVGFSYFPETEDLHLQYLSDFGHVISSVDFPISDVQKINKLKLN